MTLAERLTRLEEAAAAVRDIGLAGDAQRAAAVVERARTRTGFVADAYVLAFAGGTGVGKSSLLNALAGHTVSTVRAVRPTTETPVAWVAEARRHELAPLLAWLGVEHQAGHAEPDLAAVAVLDLPDVDSVRTEHRALVDELLPRLDALVWVLDPEKYDDERFHAYLRDLAPHHERLRFVLNKADRLTDAQRAEVAADLERRLVGSGIAQPRVHVVSAATGDGVASLRAALAGEANAKALVVAKLETDARQELVRLGELLGVDPDGAYRPLLPDDRRRAAVEASVAGALAVIDPPGVERQVAGAVLARARASGGSLLGRTVALLGWMTGQRRRSADPAGYLRDWRKRGTLGRVVNPVRAAILEAGSSVPADARAAVLRALGADGLEETTTRALDRVARDAAAEFRVRGSVLWGVIGLLQLVAGGVFLASVAWYVTLYLAGGSIPVDTVEVPALGPIPMPLLLLVGSIGVSAVLGFLLALHAGWIGRRLARRLSARVREAVGEAIAASGTAGLDRVEAVRRTIAGGLGGMT
ncbi:MAG TPA: GTPase [Candidatus Limnocylindria bacterium]|nr:GTPase [Candidatus Limnocylindria bacterium]